MLIMEQLSHYHNGEFLKENEIHYSVNDVGLLRGYGVFDFFRIEEDIPMFIEDHLDRFEHSAEGLGLDIPISRDEIKDIVKKLIAMNQIPRSSIKILLTGGDSQDGFVPGKPNLTILHKPIKYPSQELYEKGAALMLHEYQRTFPDIKSTNYLTALRLQKTWDNEGFIDVLYYTGDQVWEASRSSVFFFDGDTLVTNKEGVLKGISASKIIEACKQEVEIVIRPIGLKELLASDEMFISSTNKRVLPITRLGDHQIGPGKPGPKTIKVGEIYRKFAEAYKQERKSNQG